MFSNNASSGINSFNRDQTIINSNLEPLPYYTLRPPSHAQSNIFSPYSHINSPSIQNSSQYISPQIRLDQLNISSPSLTNKRKTQISMELFPSPAKKTKLPYTKSCASCGLDGHERKSSNLCPNNKKYNNNPLPVAQV